jgi:hypothetical protein
VKPMKSGLRGGRLRHDLRPPPHADTRNELTISPFVRILHAGRGFLYGVREGKGRSPISQVIKNGEKLFRLQAVSHEFQIRKLAVRGDR